MANSLMSPGLIKAANDALVKAAPELNLVRLFAYDMSEEFSDYGKYLKVPVAGSGDISSFNETTNDYENQDGTVTYAQIALDKQPKSTFEFKGTDILEAPNAPYWNRVAEAAANGIKGSISYGIGQLFTPENCQGGKTILSGEVTKKKLANLRSACTSRVADTVLALAPAQYEEALSLFDSNVLGDAEAVRNGYVGNLYGFKAVIQMKDLPDGVIGALIPTNSIAVASRAVTVGDASCYSEVGTAVDEYGFAITILRHGSARTGKAYLNATSLWGCAVVQPEMIKYISAS